MFDDGRITGLLDFEHAHVGDPMMDLAALRIRDTLKNLGDLVEIAGALRGGHRSRRSITTSSSTRPCCTTRLSVASGGPPLADPMPGTDWISYLAWYVNGARLGVRVDRRDPRLHARTGRDSRRATDPPRARATGTWSSGLPRAAGRGRDDYELSGLGRIASHLKRVDEIGAQFDADDLAALTDLLGHRPDPADADAELVDYIEQAVPSTRRPWSVCSTRGCSAQHLTMASPTSLMLRHPALRSLRPERATDRAATTRAGPPAPSPAPADRTVGHSPSTAEPRCARVLAPQW